MQRKSLLAIALCVLVAACSSTDDEAAPGGPSVTDAGGGAPAAGTFTAPKQGAAGGAPWYEQRSLDAREAERALVEIGDRVFFGYDRYDLSAEARSTLDRQARLLTAQRPINVIVEGHCDERGTREYNLALGERRSNAVRDYLIALGISPSRIRSVSYGDERPAVVGSGDDAWAQNRRAVTVVVGAAAGS